MGGGSSSPAECICSTRFCTYRTPLGISDPKTPSEPEKIDAIDEATNSVAEFMQNNCEYLYEQTKNKLKTSTNQGTEGTVMCLNTKGAYISTTDKTEPFKQCHKGYRPVHANRTNVCALVASIVALLLFSTLMVFFCLYHVHRKTVTKPVNEDQLTEPLSSL